MGRKLKSSGREGSVSRRRRNNSPVRYPALEGIHPVLGFSMHNRYLPANHKYSIKYALHMYKFDCNKPPPSPAFTRSDHFGDESYPLEFCVRREVFGKLGFWPEGHIEMICNLRSYGFCFNPITPYFVHDLNGTLQALVLEVHNTPWNERCLYTMHVHQGNRLEPDVHLKVMHVSPFNAPPGVETPQTYYKFSIEGKTSLHIEVLDGKDSSAATRMTASWALQPGATHTISTGSWRTFLIIYWKALMLFSSGLGLYTYDLQPLPWSSPLLLCQGGFVGIAFAHFITGTRHISTAFVALAFALWMHHRLSEVNLGCMWISIACSLICIHQGLALSRKSETTEVICGSALICWFLSLIVPNKKFVRLRLVTYGNSMVWGISLLALDTPPSSSMAIHAVCAWLTFFCIVDCINEGWVGKVLVGVQLYLAGILLF